MLLFSHREVSKIFLCLKIAEMDKGVNFGSNGTNLDIETYFFKLNQFSGVKYPNSMTCFPAGEPSRKIDQSVSFPPTIIVFQNTVE